ncbi:palmdelphin isoform X4 [Electrophorus electricus]|uniref:palmdelphin isoform X4 n=1 Tax=Electrophorus electricus TaxID=8005 RepID=UPI0015CFBCE0|nr:palmdelphin isoform X4 [Electrophorus electricus]
MEEADLLRERLQAITEKRRIQEEITKKRRELEELKLKLQYLKKKALREQWLMDGMSGQSEQEEEAMRVQAREEQQQAELLQSHVDRMEDEIKDLETKETNISVNEEVILKRLKEVEKTTADIIKEVNGDAQPESVQRIYSAISDASFTPTLMKRLNNPVQEPAGKPEKKAMYAMEISVEKDLRTGESQVLSSATITSQDFQRKGIKVYDDGRKSVYAVQLAGDGCDDGVDELSPLDVEELLRKATQKNSLTNLECHEPVFSHYSRLSTPRKEERGLVSLAPSGLPSQSKTPSPLHLDSFREEEDHGQADAKLLSSHFPQHKTKQYLHTGQSAYQSAINGQKANLTNVSVYSNKQELIQETEKQQRFTPKTESELGLERYSPLHPNNESAFIVDSIPSELESHEPVTMIFMGYQNAESDEEDEAIKAELVIIGNNEEENDEEALLSYHPQGYHSKIFQPRNDNIHRSEVRCSFIKSHNSGGSLMRYRGDDFNDSVIGMKTPQLGKLVQLPQSKTPGWHI